MAAVRVKRGSQTTKFARLISLAASRCCTATGCASAAFEPMNTRVLALRMSL
jgi:hypothetical protein